MDPMTCTECGIDVDPLDLFPRNRCLSCHAKAFDLAHGLGVSRMTASDVAAMWGAK